MAIIEEIKQDSSQGMKTAGIDVSERLHQELLKASRIETIWKDNPVVLWQLAYNEHYGNCIAVKDSFSLKAKAYTYGEVIDDEVELDFFELQYLHSKGQLRIFTESEVPESEDLHDALMRKVTRIETVWKDQQVSLWDLKYHIIDDSNVWMKSKCALWATVYLDGQLYDHEEELSDGAILKRSHQIRYSKLKTMKDKGNLKLFSESELII